MKQALLLLITLLALAACTNPARKVSESSLRNATASSAAEELRGIGYVIRNTLRCTTLSADTISVVRVRCTGRTTRNQPVRVDAVAYDANSANPRQEYVITIGGREVVRTACLGQGCRDSDP